MRMNKKLILSLLIVASLVVGAGVGTYAAFSTSASTQNNKIKAGTVKLMNGTASVTLFDLAGIKPGDYEDGEHFIDARSDGTLPIKISVQFNPVFKNESGVVLSNGSNYDLFEVEPIITYYRNNSEPVEVRLEWTPARQLADTINNYTLTNQTLSNVVFNRGEGIVLKLNARLNENADNIYQGVSVEGEFVINASNN